MRIKICNKAAGNEQFVLDSVSKDTKISFVQEQVQEKWGIQSSQVSFLIGFPPKPLTCSPSQSLQESGIASGTVLYVQKTVYPQIQRVEIPSDNSCLFNAIGYLLTSDSLDNSSRLRQIVVDAVKSRPEQYSEAILGKSIPEYCSWILNPKSWGGEVELSILCMHFAAEIGVVDIKTTNIYVYGQEQGYSRRIYILYDGIHYDSLVKGSCKVFSAQDAQTQEMVREFSRDLQISKRFVDTHTFTLRCEQCSQGLSGQTEAAKHAQQTGHVGFTQF